MHQGNSCNTVVGCWLSNRHIMTLSGHRNNNSIPSRPTMLEHRCSSSRCAVMFSHLSWVHKPHKPNSKCKSSVGTSSNLNNLDPLIVLWFQTSKTSLKARWAIQLLNHLLGLPNQASSRYFQKRRRRVTFILKFFTYRIVNLFILSFVFTEL